MYANYVNIEIHFDSSFGVPAGLEGLSWRDISIAKVMKKNLLSGKEQSLTVPKKKKRLAYPSKVLEYGKLHWEQITILEPSQHKRSGPSSATIQDDTESVPSRLQDLTNSECYEDFKIMYGQKIENVMKKHSEDLLKKVANWPDSPDKQGRLEFAEKTRTRFPSQSWYLLQKLEEVIPMYDHTTG